MDERIVVFDDFVGFEKLELVVVWDIDAIFGISPTSDFRKTENIS